MTIVPKDEKGALSEQKISHMYLYSTDSNKVKKDSIPLRGRFIM